MKNIINIPNSITFLRFILLIPIAYLIFKEEFLIACLLFILFSTMDAIDGFLAKKLNQKTKFGSYFDPAVDIIGIISIGIILFLIKRLDLIYLIFIFLIRGISTIIRWLTNNQNKEFPIIFQKVPTFLIYIFTVIILLGIKNQILNFLFLIFISCGFLILWILYLKEYLSLKI